MDGLADALEGLLPALAALAEADPDREVCGFVLAAQDGSVELSAARNVAAEPARRFEVDPRDLLAVHRLERAGGPRLAAVYHSHPTGDAGLSATDRAALLLDGAPLLPGVELVVVGVRGGRAVEVRLHRWAAREGFREVIRAARLAEDRTDRENGSWVISANVPGSRG
jgi:proteasome lid subunit RPN8/RPN11